jgi:hypothetical protein
MVVPGSGPRNVPNRGKVPNNIQVLYCGSTSGGSSREATVTNTLGHDAPHNFAVLLASVAVADLGYASTSVPVSPGRTKL